jgi:hypothetical protein
MKAILDKQVATVEETCGDYIVLRTEPWATTMVHLSHRDLVIDPTDEQIATVERGEDLPRCVECESLGCNCAEIAALMDESGITKKKDKES